MNLFDFVKAINKGENILDQDNEGLWNGFMIGRAFSQHADTVIIANEMNIRRGLTPRMENDFYLSMVRKNPKRFSKWAKLEETPEFLAVKEYYGYNSKQTRNVMPLLSEEQIEEIMGKVAKGGKQQKGKRS